MNTLPAAYGGSSLRDDPGPYGVSNTRTDHNLSNNIHGDSNTNVGNVLNSYNTINMDVRENSLRVQAWLSPLEPHSRHRDVSNRRLDGVGDWVLQRNEFESWHKTQGSSGNSTLLCYGVQGVGKTFISSLVIDSLREHTCRQNILVLSLYCDYQAQKDQSAVNIIGSLLNQVASAATQIPAQIESAFELKQRGGHSLRLPEMLKLFVETTSSFERVYICLDAVDELLPENRSELLRTLRQIVQDAPNIRLFLTGRPYIRGELEKHLAQGANIIHIIADHRDIARYISQKIDDDDDRHPDSMPDHLKEDVLKTILEKNSEMFLLVALHIDAILGETTLAKRKDMLRKVASIGVDLDSVYSQTLQRIREQKGDWSRLGMEVLMWVSHSERPLRIDELCHALAVEMGSTELNPENICQQHTVLGSCLGLAMVDRETSEVRLIHYTLQEYLCLPGVLPNAHETLALTCLTYLNYTQIKGLPANTAPNLRDMPFLEYSSFYWGSHAKAELSDAVRLLALQLLSQYNSHISATLLFNKIKRYGYGFVAVSLFTGLHCASYFGIVEVVEELIEMKGYDINQADSDGLTPHMWAALRGNEGVVGLLLARGDIKPDKRDNEGRTLLWWASLFGREGVAALLLARGDVDPDRADNRSCTPLSGASAAGYEAVVRLLLARDNVNPDRPDHECVTPLSWASRAGHEGVVRLLLARDDVNPDSRSFLGGTPLSNACMGGHEGVVRLLLSRDDVNPGWSDNSGYTPLRWASGQGHEETVRLLLSRDGAKPDKPDTEGRTPLWIASRNGYEGIVRLLLARDDIDPDKQDNGGQTPLQVASIHRRREIVVLLQSRTTATSSLD